MRASTLLCIDMLLTMSFFLLACSDAISDCKTPPFDRRRCYQLYSSKPGLTWYKASAACIETGQRLASMENGDLVKFVAENFEFQWASVGLSRTSLQESDTWTSGHKLDRTQYRNVGFAQISRGPPEALLCWVAFVKNFYATNPYTLGRNNCTTAPGRICETIRSSIFQVKLVGDVVYDVSSGQAVESDVDMSVIDCVRKCRYDWTCQAISHNGVTCKLHFSQSGHNIIVSSNAAVYMRMKIE